MDFSLDEVESGITRYIRGGATVTRQGCISPPFSLIQNKTDDFSASFALLRRKALRPFPQTFATFASNVCNLCLKRLHPLPQTFASFASNVCKYLQTSPQSIASFPASVCLFWHKRYPLPDFVHLIPTCRYAPLCVRMTAKYLSYVSEYSYAYSLFCRMLLFYLSYIMQDLRKKCNFVKI